jgi:2-hydroxychromene-2-carboxylate isomerase
MVARIRARAQMYATTRLRALYPEDWKTLYREELTRIREEEGLTGDKI